MNFSWSRVVTAIVAATVLLLVSAAASTTQTPTPTPTTDKEAFALVGNAYVSPPADSSTWSPIAVVNQCSNGNGLHSGGLSGYGGYVCLTDAQIQFMQSRGGNASSNPVGAKPQRGVGSSAAPSYAPSSAL